MASHAVDTKLISSAAKEKAAYGSLKSEKSFATRTTGIPTVCWFILVVELCERLCFYTFAGSQAFFLEHIGYSVASAGGLNATMWTLCTVLAVLASWFADVVAGRYTVILCAGALYVCGTTLAALAAIPGHENAALYFVGVLGFMPLATAGIKANISNFGADQYDITLPGAEQAQEKFFSIFYSSINVGAAIAYGFFTTFASSGGPGVPKVWGYFAAYIIMSGFMIASVMLFTMGRSKYQIHPILKRSALGSTFKVLFQNATRGSVKAMAVITGFFLFLIAIILSALDAIMSGSGQVMLVAAFICAGIGAFMVVLPCLSPSWLKAIGETGGFIKEAPVDAEQPAPQGSLSRARQARDATRLKEVSEVRDFLALLPVLFTGSLSFGAVYNCMQFWYQQQACQMDLRMGSVQLVGSFFSIADCLAIVIVTPIALDWFNPSCEWFLGRQMGTRLKFSIGMLVAGVSVIVAARLESLRRQADILPIESNCAPAGVGMSDVKGAWMVVPFFLMGVGEIYTQPTLLHYAYSRSPPSMRTLAMAASFFIQAVSSALFALLVAALSQYIPNDLNHGHLEYGYYINLAIGAFFFLCFLAVVPGGK